MKSILMAAKPRRRIAKGLGAPVLKGALPVGLSNFAAGLYNGKIDVFGGLTAGSTSKTRQQYDIAKQQWTASADLFDFNWGPGITTPEGFWVGAGFINGAFNNRLFKFDLAALGTRAEKAVMDGGARVQARMALTEDRYIHVVAGYNSGGPRTSNLHYTYDIPNNQWIQRTSAPYSANGHVVCSYKGKLYMAGGYSDDNAANRNNFSQYNPADGKWTAMPPMPYATSWVNGGLVNNLLVVGAIVSAKIVLMVFDFETGVWSTVNTGLAQRWAGEWVADDNGIWLLGGCVSSPGTANYNNLAKFSDMYYFPLTY